jgi:serine-type D-Ala-D-Ala carboxypeptidase/endopeptidase (penicillin-binding protein 4)
MRFFTIILCCVSSWAMGQQADRAGVFHEVKNSVEMKGADISWCVIGAKGEVKHGFEQDKRMIPASTLKALVSGVAWMEKGAQMTWETRVGIRGLLDRSGTLYGDVVILPEGDPGFASGHLATAGIDKILEGVHSALKDFGVDCIEGDWVLRTSENWGNPVPGSWPREDVGNYYGGGIWPLNVQDNAYEICFSNRQRQGDRPQILHVSPRVEGMSWDNQLGVGPRGSGDQAYIFGGPETYRKAIYGTIPEGLGPFCIKGAIPNPGIYFLNRLKQYCIDRGLKSQGVKIEGSGIADQIKDIWSHRSPPLEDIVRKCLQKSLNHYADGLLMVLSKKGEDKWKSATSRIETWVEGLDPNGPIPVIKDGSGMSPGNAITARQIALGLQSFHLKMKDWPTFRDCFTKDPVVNHLYYKSGSMSGVQCYAGYIQRGLKDVDAFAICVNRAHPEYRVEIRNKLLAQLRADAGFRK